MPQSQPPFFPVDLCFPALTPFCPVEKLIPFPEPQIAQMAPRWRKYFVVHSPSGKQYASLFCATQGVALPIPRLPFWPEGSWIQLASFLVCASGCSTLKAHNP
eukprot:g36273.t1